LPDESDVIVVGERRRAGMATYNIFRQTTGVPTP
jgi:hypothetical protein